MPACPTRFCTCWSGTASFWSHEMTGYAIDYRADRISVASDALAYDDDGVAIGLCNKVERAADPALLDVQLGQGSLARERLRGAVIVAAGPALRGSTSRPPAAPQPADRPA